MSNFRDVIIQIRDAKERTRDARAVLKGVIADGYGLKISAELLKALEAFALAELYCEESER